MDSGEDDSEAGQTLESVLDVSISFIRLFPYQTNFQVCVAHLTIQTQAETHYRAVCRALAVETEELIVFLNQIKRAQHRTKNLINRTPDSPDSGLSELETGDWARLWMQVIRQLRNGAKLKKVDLDKVYHPRTEFEFTPYEMLLNDIRSKRHTLRHVEEEKLRRVKKDAHEMILEFIRSRPPLVPVSKRRLSPVIPKTPTVYERLMTSIRQKHDLKPIPCSLRRESSGIVLGRVVGSEKIGEYMCLNSFF